MRVLFALIVSLAIVYAQNPTQCTGWSYRDTTPSAWGAATCGSGITNMCNRPAAAGTQSPVSISSSNVVEEPSLLRLAFNTKGYTRGSYQLTNFGFTAELAYNPTEAYFSAVPLNNVNYYLSGIEFHVPGENTVGAYRSSVEVILKHSARDASGSRAFVSMFFDVTPTTNNDLLEPVIQGLKSVPKVGDKFSVTFNGLQATLEDIQNRNLDAYYHFMGSLVYPPCTENVHYFVFQNRWSISQVQYDALRLLIGSDSRPAQRTLVSVDVWDPVLSAGSHVHSYHCLGEDYANNWEIDIDGAEDCISQYEGTECAFCVTYREGEEVATCFDRNGATCEELQESLTAYSYCQVDLKCPAASISFSVLVLLSVAFFFYNL